MVLAQWTMLSTSLGYGLAHMHAYNSGAEYISAHFCFAIHLKYAVAVW